KRYSCNKTTGFSALPALEKSQVMQVHGAPKMSINKGGVQ
ncbi:DUF977 family protein, partial [Salmonella enterica subsp. enterica serovar Choleraesuis]|nr:DUF977 family protein [Salmonella enterica subsp. enterica serovar Choleraesuis]